MVNGKWEFIGTQAFALWEREALQNTIENREYEYDTSRFFLSRVVWFKPRWFKLKPLGLKKKESLV